MNDNLLFNLVYDVKRKSRYVIFKGSCFIICIWLGLWKEYCKVERNGLENGF